MSTTPAPKRYASWNPPPQGYVPCYQDSDDGVVETLKSSGKYCPSCYTITRDLSVFADPPEEIGDKVAVVFWELHIKDLVETADGGCHFCGFIASRLLNDPGFTFIYSNHSSTQRVSSCCHQATRTEINKDVSNSVENLRKFLQDEPDANFTVAVEPVKDYLREEKQVGKVRLSLFRSNLSREAAAKFLGYRTQIILELYALKGKFRRLWLGMVSNGKEANTLVHQTAARQSICDTVPSISTPLPTPVLFKQRLGSRPVSRVIRTAQAYRTLNFQPVFSKLLAMTVSNYTREM